MDLVFVVLVVGFVLDRFAGWLAYYSLRGDVRQVSTYLDMMRTVDKASIRVVSDDRICGIVIGQDPRTQRPVICMETLGHTGVCREWATLAGRIPEEMLDGGLTRLVESDAATE